MCCIKHVDSNRYALASASRQPAVLGDAGGWFTVGRVSGK